MSTSLEETPGRDRAAGLDVVRAMLPADYVRHFENLPSQGPCNEMGLVALDTVFSKLWTRPGLDARSRSLVTLGILLALRADDEFAIHVRIGLRNGLTRQEIEELVYHGSGYAGFPAASKARTAVAAAFRAEDQGAGDQS